MKKKVIIIGTIILVLLLLYAFFFSDFFYYLNAKNNISLKHAEKLKTSDKDSLVTLDYVIQDDTIYYYSKKDHLILDEDAYIYKSDINGNNLERVCKFKDSSFNFGFVYNNKLYYKDTMMTYNSHNFDGSKFKVDIYIMDLNSCARKKIFTYNYETLENRHNLYKPENSILELTYTNDGHIIGSNKTFIFDMYEEKALMTASDKEKDVYVADGKIYYNHNSIYKMDSDISVEIFSHNDNYIYLYSEFEDVNYIYKLDIKNKKIVNKEKINGKDIGTYYNDYMYVNKKLYKYNYDTDKLDLVLKKIDEGTEFTELDIINNYYVFTFIADGTSYAGDEQTFDGKMFVYDSNGKLVFKENQNEYTNTFRNAIIDGNKVHVIYSNGKVKTLDLSK